MVKMITRARAVFLKKRIPSLLALAFVLTMTPPLFFSQQAEAQGLFDDRPRLFGKVATDKTLIGIEANRPLVGWEPLEFNPRVIENRLRVTVYAPLLEGQGEIVLRLEWWREVERPVGPNGTTVKVIEDRRFDNVSVRASSKGPVTSIVAIPSSPEESFLRISYLDVYWVVKHKTLRSLLPFEQVYADLQLFALTVMLVTGMVAGACVVAARGIIRRVKYVPPLDPAELVIVLAGVLLLFMAVLLVAFEVIATSDWWWWEIPFALVFLTLVSHYVAPQAERWLFVQVRPKEANNDRIVGRTWTPYIARDPDNPDGSFYYIDEHSRMEVLYRLLGLRSRITFPPGPKFYVEDENGNFRRIYFLTSDETPTFGRSRLGLKRSRLHRDGPPLAVAVAGLLATAWSPWSLLVAIGGIVAYFAGRLRVVRTECHVPLAGMHGEDLAKAQADLAKLEDVAKRKSRLELEKVELEAKLAAGEARMFQEGMKVLMRQVFTVVEPEADQEEELQRRLEEYGRRRRQDRRKEGPEGAE
jgi:hypothetical protein